MELTRFDDQRLTVMPVPVPEVTYSDVKDLKVIYYTLHTVTALQTRKSQYSETSIIQMPN